MNEPKNYERADSLTAYGRAIIETFEEFSHLLEADIAYLFSQHELRLRGRSCAGITMMPDAQGQSKFLFYWVLEKVFGFIPDVIIIIDQEYWEETTEEARVALMYHELHHIYQKESTKGPCFDKETGKAILILKDHDLGEFHDVAEKFGAWDGTIETFRNRLDDKAGKIDLKPVIALAEQYGG